MPKTRTIKKKIEGKPVIEGAGVHLRRIFGFGDTALTDPFLLLDDFRSDTPEHYRKGFPWHPHRGIETITYVLAGDVAHGDSLGNKGVIGAGDVQWMTAGSGIVHQEMPAGDDDGKMYGFQLWANLPARRKMMDPRYREVSHAEIPTVTPADGVSIKVIAGQVSGTRGPVRDVVIEPEYLDVTVGANASFTHRVQPGHTVMAYIIGGRGGFGGFKEPAYGDGTLLIFDDGDEVAANGGEDELRFLLISGKPIDEPVAWRGPIVMNTQEELQLAFEEYRQGTFIKYQG
jgi:redox-sensitive bicupin YhaK (pirin superfamily)